MNTMEENNAFKSRYRILKELKLVVECHEGILTLENMIRFRKDQGMTKEFSPHYNILMDMRRVSITGTPMEVSDYVSFYKQNRNITGNRYIAVLTDTPNQVFYITLFEKFSDMLSQKTKIFSTLEASLNWLRVDAPVSLIESMIRELRRELKEE